MASNSSSSSSRSFPGVRDLGQAVGVESQSWIALGRQPDGSPLDGSSSDDGEEEEEEGFGQERRPLPARGHFLARRFAQAGLASLLLYGAAHAALRGSPWRLQLRQPQRQPPSDRQRGRPAIVHDPSALKNLSGAWKLRDPRPLGRFCNPDLEHPKVEKAVAFDMASSWKAFCWKVQPPAGSFFTSHWKGQDACWAWVKKVGCYETRGMMSWRDGQEKAACRGFAPHPQVQLMPGLRKSEICEHRELGHALEGVSAEETEAATRWIGENIGIYVLNLDRDVDRLKNMKKRMAELDLNFTRVPGVNLAESGGLDWAYREGLVPQEFNYTLAQLNANTSYQGIGGILGTVGCAAAHLNTMRTIEEELLPQQRVKPLVLILEDDVVLRDDFAVKLQRLLRTEVPCDWAALSLMSRCPYGRCISPHVTRVEPDGNEPEDRCRHGVNYGFFAMLYRTRHLASIRKRLASIVWNDARPRCLDVDVALASISDEVPYYAVPAIQQPGFLSEGDQGSSRWKLNQATTTTTSTLRPPPTTTTTLTTSTVTVVAHFPSIPGTDERREIPILALGDGHYGLAGGDVGDGDLGVMAAAVDR